jgi:hypothetical protein
MMRFFGRIVSFLTHPLLVLSYVLVLMLAINPFLFGVRNISDQRSVLLLISVFTTSFMLPALGIALMKPLGLIQSLALREKQERIGPFIICGVFYLWLYQNFLHGVVPVIFANFTLGATIALFLTFFVNIFVKISAYTAGMGSLVAMILMLAFSWPGHTLSLGFLQLSLNALFALVLLVAGLTGVNHTVWNGGHPAEAWRGYAVGFAGVLVANFNSLF